MKRKKHKVQRPCQLELPLVYWQEESNNYRDLAGNQTIPFLIKREQSKKTPDYVTSMKHRRGETLFDT